jgi:polyisoprenyl-teichoic acid--peptidoglycan teichoic acid transferase
VTQSKQDHRVRSAPAADTVGDDHPAREIRKRTIGESTLAWLRLRWPRLALIIGCVLAVLSGLVIAGRFAVDQATGTVHQLTINTNGNESVVQGTPVNGELNILLVGLDNGQAVGGELRTDPAHSDSMMILHVSASHDQGYLISLPRDLWVAIPGHGSGKLNAAFTFGSAGTGGSAGGLDLLMRTINSLWGIKFNAAATVNFNGFTQALQILGGVTMDIDETVTSVHYGTTKPDGTGVPCVPARFDANAVAHPVKGCYGKVYLPQKARHLTPVEALDYTRQREWMSLNDGDYGRQRHQQQFIKALVQEAKAQGLTTNPAKAFSLIRSVGSTLEVWTNGASLTDWFLTLKDLSGDKIESIKTNNGAFHSEIINGQSTESLDDTSKAMLRALSTGQLEAFLAQHPQVLNTTPQPVTATPSP